MRTSNSPREILGLSNCRPGIRWHTAHLHCTPEGEGEGRGGERRGGEGGEESEEKGKEGEKGMIWSQWVMVS